MGAMQDIIDQAMQARISTQSQQKAAPAPVSTKPIQTPQAPVSPIPGMIQGAAANMVKDVNSMLAEKPPGGGNYAPAKQDMAEQRRIAETMKQIRYNETPPENPKLPDSPPLPHGDSFDVFKQFMPAMLILGGGLSRRHAGAAITSAAAMTQAYANGQKQEYEAAREKWKEDTEKAINQHKMDMERWDSLNKGKELNARNLLETSGLYGHLTNDEVAIAAHQAADANLAWEHRQSKIKMQQELIKSLTDIQKEDDLRQKYAGSSSVDWKNAKDTDPVAGTGLSVGAIKQVAEGVVKTGNYQQSGLGYGWNPAKQAVDNYLAAAHPEFNRADAALGFIGKTAAVRLGAKNFENIQIASQNLDRSIPLLLDEAKKVDPSNFRTWNDLTNYLEEKKGDPALSGLRNTINDTRADYAQLLARGGQVTDAVRKHADENLDAAFTEGQFDEVARIIYLTSQNQRDASKSAMASAYDTPMGGRKKVSTQAEFDALPSGAEYEEDGTLYRKP